MKKLLPIFGLIMLTILSACKDSHTDGEITVITPAEVQEAVYDSQPHQLVDVRTAEEFSDGHLRNAQNICVTDDDFEEKMEKLDKDQPVYVYCRSGKRSAKAAKILKEMGFTEIYDMEGGYLNWESERLETEK